MRGGRTELALAGLVVLAGGCRTEFVIGLIEGGGSTEFGSTVEDNTAEGTISGSSGTTTLSGTGDGTGSSSEGSSTGPGIDDVPMVECEAPTGHTVCDSDGNQFQAIGLDCPGGTFESTAIENELFTSPDNNAWRVTREYGNTTFGPTEGTNLLVLSTGIMPAADGSGRVELTEGETDSPGWNNGNLNGVLDLPEPIDPISGSSGAPFMGCDGVGDCSESLPTPWQAGAPANNVAWLTFDVDVPVGTFGYQVDVAWFSAEYPARWQAAATDLVVWWQSDESFTGNVATIDGAALSASTAAGWLADYAILGDDTDLLGTGYQGTTGAACPHPDGGTYPDCPRGAGTGWMTLSGPAQPSVAGEAPNTMTITLAIFDLVDTDRDTAFLVDNWRWHCEGCEPGVDCGLTL